MSPRLGALVTAFLLMVSCGGDIASTSTQTESGVEYEEVCVDNFMYLVFSTGWDDGGVGATVKYGSSGGPETC